MAFRERSKLERVPARGARRRNTESDEEEELEAGSPTPVSACMQGKARLCEYNTKEEAGEEEELKQCLSMQGSIVHVKALSEVWNHDGLHALARGEKDTCFPSA